MFDNIKRLKKLNKEVESELSTTGENATDIYVCCAETSDALSPFCQVEQPVISSEFADYLENKAERLHIGENINIKIQGNADKAVLKKAIVNYYESKLSNAQREFSKNGILSCIFTVLAVLILTAAVLINTFLETRLVLQEIIDIAGWVFMWEAVDMFFLQRGTLRIKQIRYLNFIRATVE